MKMKNNTFDKDKRNKRNIEILGGFIYEAIGGEMLELFIYDKKKKLVFAGVLKPSSYSKKEILEREYCK